MPTDIAIDTFLTDEGFITPWARHQSRTVLEQAGLTRKGKQAMSSAKLVKAREYLSLYVVRVCGDPGCAALAEVVKDGRLVVETRSTQCAICGGSNNRRAALLLGRACAARSVTRLLILGGTPALHAELESLLVPTGLSLRCIDGASGAHAKTDALPNLNWAQVMAVWASTPLPHKVSVSYTDERPRDLPTVTVGRRGIEALCNAVRQTVEGMPAATGPKTR